MRRSEGGVYRSKKKDVNGIPHFLKLSTGKFVVVGYYSCDFQGRSFPTLYGAQKAVEALIKQERRVQR